MKHVVLMLILCCTPLPALAHKVIAGVFASGDVIEGEIGLSNGTMAVDTEVIITGPDGTELGRTVTDEDGFFRYAPTTPVAHTFFADLGAGHVARVTMAADDVARIMGMAKPEPVAVGTGAALPPPAAQGVTVASLSDEERQVIADLVRAEMRPLRRELAAYREQNDMQTILGGIGYIVGLFGLAFYFAARRKLAA